MTQTDFWISLFSSLIGAGFGSIVAYMFGNRQIKKQIEVSQEISDDEKRFNILLNARKNVADLHHKLYENHFYQNEEYLGLDVEQVLDGLYKAHMSHNHSCISLVTEIDTILFHIGTEDDLFEKLVELRKNILNKSIEYNDIDIIDLKRLLNGHSVTSVNDGVITLDKFEKDYNDTTNEALNIVLELNQRQSEENKLSLNNQ